MEWIHCVMGNGGLYLLLVVVLLVINLLPPVPAETVVPMSASLFAYHDYSMPLAILAATLGLFLGTLPWFYLGRAYGEERFKKFLRDRRWLAVTPQDIDRSGRWFRRYGPAIVIAGRFIPGMRSLISIPAGFHHMPTLSFLICTWLGSALWATLLITAGHWLAQSFPGVTALRIFIVMLVVFAIFYCYRLIRH